MLRNALRRLLVVGLLFGSAGGAWAARQARITGTVQDVAGNGIEGAVITVTCEEQKDFNKTVKCLADGTYSLLLIDATRHYVFMAEAEGHVSVEHKVKVPPGSTDNVVDIELQTPDQLQQSDPHQLLEQPGYREMEEGRKLFGEGKLEDAKAKFAAAVELIPDVTQAWLGLCTIADQLGDAQTAHASANRCLALDEEALGCLAVAINSARVLGLGEEYDEFVSRYNKLNPEDPAMLFNRAAEFLNNMDDDQARPLLEQCLAADPAFGRCLFEFGMLLLRNDDLEGAKEKLQEYLKVDPEGPDAATAAETIKYL